MKNMIEAAAEANEEMMEKYLEGGELSRKKLRLGLRQRTLGSRNRSLSLWTAFKNKGVQAMLDAVVDYLPAPDEVEAIRGIKDDETEDTRPADDDAPFAALAFKIATDPYVGTLTFFRVYSGVLNGGPLCSTG